MKGLYRNVSDGFVFLATLPKLKIYETKASGDFDEENYDILFDLRAKWRCGLKSFFFSSISLCRKTRMNEKSWLQQKKTYGATTWAATRERIVMEWAGIQSCKKNSNADSPRRIESTVVQSVRTIGLGLHKNKSKKKKKKRRILYLCMWPLNACCIP